MLHPAGEKKTRTASEISRSPFLSCKQLLDTHFKFSAKIQLSANLYTEMLWNIILEGVMTKPYVHQQLLRSTYSINTYMETMQTSQPRPTDEFCRSLILTPKLFQEAIKANRNYYNLWKCRILVLFLMGLHPLPTSKSQLISLAEVISPKWLESNTEIADSTHTLPQQCKTHMTKLHTFQNNSKGKHIHPPRVSPCCPPRRESWGLPRYEGPH